MTEPKNWPKSRIERLVLRRWCPEDLKPMARINGDPHVMEFFPAPMAEAETKEMLRKIDERFEQDGFGFWALELKETGALVGFCGLNRPREFQAHFTPCVEIGWRLAHEHWGKGLAPEGALAALRFGFDEVGLGEIVSFTTEKNTRSRRVMEKIGMIYDPSGDFDHPKLAEGHPLRRHVLYRLQRERAQTQ